MFFTSEIIKKAFHSLKNIDSSDGKSRKEKISGLRYLLATSQILKSIGTNELDMKVGSPYRNDFIIAVGGIVSLNSHGLYTKDFDSEFDEKKDYGIGSNFYTTRLSSSRSQLINYPGRPAPLLHLEHERISIIEHVNSALITYYNIKKIKAALCIWIMRNENINLESNASYKNIAVAIKQFISSKFTSDVSFSLIPDESEIASFLAGTNEKFLSAEPYDSSLIKNEASIIIPNSKKDYLLSSNSEPSQSSVIALNDDISEEDEVLNITKKLLDKGSKGILFSGPPGTSKTWYALKIAIRLTSGDATKVERIQFHPSYSYEDFIEGLVPTGSVNSTEPMFKAKDKIFIKLCEEARKDLDSAYILVIDEFSRGEPSKIFGELLTYIEPDYRDIEFILPYSEKRVSIPQNVLIFATMNPYDRSVVELDSAMERRFEIIEMNPNKDILQKILSSNGIHGDKLDRITNFFNKANELTPHGFGHTFFKNIETDNDLILLWNHKLKFIFSKIFKFNSELYVDIRQCYMDILDLENKELIK